MKLKLLYIALIIILCSSCKRYIKEYTIVESIGVDYVNDTKYEVKLTLIYGNCYLYTDSNIYSVGDTLWLRKRN